MAEIECGCCDDAARFPGSGEPPCPTCGHSVLDCNGLDARPLARAFRAALASSGITGQDFAERLHLSPQFINDIKHGRRLPTPDRVLQFASQFPDVDSARWLWLLLTDLWGQETVTVMKAWAVADAREHSA